MDSFGADALRWMMLASPVMRGADIGVDPEGKFIRDVVRLNIKPMWSAYNFFTLYANADGIKAVEVTTSENTLDRYILAKAKAAVQQVQTSLDNYETPGATDAITGFFDVLNNWYIRRSRARFWDEEVTADKTAAFNTLYTVLNLLVKAAAPLLPMTAEAIYRGINGEGSVHLADFPDVSAIDDETYITHCMDGVRDVCAAASAIRNKLNLRTRQPLQSLTYAGNAKFADLEASADSATFTEMVLDEVNVKEFIIAGSSFSDYADIKLQINSAVLGKRLPAKMKEILPASKKGAWERTTAGIVKIADEVLMPSEYQVLLEPKAAYKDRAQATSDNAGLIILDTTITPELEAEGRARDLVRMIQQARKDAGLHVADRIALELDIPADFKAALSAHRDYIADQVLAVSIGENAKGSDKQLTQELDGEQFTIGLTKAA
jgi:isoleucyl-tRNA synthetase